MSPLDVSTRFRTAAFGLDPGFPLALCALGRNPSALNVHSLHFGPTGRKTVYHSRQHSSLRPQREQNQRSPHLSEPDKQMVDLSMQRLGQPRFEIGSTRSV